MKTNRIPFTLEEYQGGKYKVVTRDGKSVRLICTDFNNGRQSIVALISLRNGEETCTSFNTDGKYWNNGKTSDCDLFLEETVFEDGDIIHYLNNNDETAIFKKSDKEYSDTYFCYNGRNYTIGFNKRMCGDFRLATEEEKQRLFDALAKEGKRWNSEKKCIEDIKEECELKPFDKVLVRDEDDDKWGISIFGYYDKDIRQFICNNMIYWEQCIPFEGNEELLGTTNSPKQ